jgi:hypothetical protein
LSSSSLALPTRTGTAGFDFFQRKLLNGDLLRDLSFLSRFVSCFEAGFCFDFHIMHPSVVFFVHIPAATNNATKTNGERENRNGKNIELLDIATLNYQSICSVTRTKNHFNPTISQVQRR